MIVSWKWGEILKYSRILKKNFTIYLKFMIYWKYKLFKQHYFKIRNLLNWLILTLHINNVTYISLRIEFAISIYILHIYKVINIFVTRYYSYTYTYYLIPILTYYLLTCITKSWVYHSVNYWILARHSDSFFASNISLTKYFFLW